MRTDAIKRCVPQRYPLLLLDRVLEVTRGKAARAIKNVTINEPCYAELPDDAPAHAYAYPPSLLIESLSQTAGVLLREVFEHGEHERAEHVIMFGAIKGFAFHQDVYPGDRLVHEVSVTRVIGDTAILRGTTWRDDVAVCTAEEIVVVSKPKGFA